VLRSCAVGVSHHYPPDRIGKNRHFLYEFRHFCYPVPTEDPLDSRVMSPLNISQKSCFLSAEKTGLSGLSCIISRQHGARVVPMILAPLVAMAMLPVFGADNGYNGGQPTNPKDLKGKKIVLADVPKLIGIGYFAATTKGQAEAAAELTKNGLPTEVTTDAPTEAAIQKQIEYIDNDISKGVDGILFASNDPTAISPVLRKALKAGIHVIGYDAESEPDAREWFIQQATPDGIAKALVDSMVAEVGKKADIGIVTSSLTAPNQNAWIAEIKKYISAQGLGLNIVAILPSEEDQQKAFQATGDIIKAHPTVKGIIGLSSVAFPGAADAITHANLIGKIACTGLSTPNQMKPFVKSGCVKSVVLWNPVDLGYAAVYAMRAVVDGKLKPGDTELEAGKLGKLKLINGSQFLLGPPFIFNKDNIDQFDF
jgi:rhamnose transport system substrate-binding protein